MSLVKSGPALGYENFAMSYQIVVSNAGPGPALAVQIYDTMPALTDFSSTNGILQTSNYPSNDTWRALVGSGHAGSLIARGPFNIAIGQAVTVQLDVVPLVPSGGTSITNTALAFERVYNSSAANSVIIPIANSGVVPTATNVPSATRTFSFSPTRSVTPTLTPSPTLTASPSPTVTESPGPALTLSKSANRGAVISAGDQITYVLSLQNGGGYQASGVSIWDSLPSNVTLLSSAPAATVNAGVLSWTLGSLGTSSSSSFSFAVSFTGSGVDVPNQAAAAASNNAMLLSNLNVVAVGSTFTDTPTLTSSPTPTETPSPTPTSTIVLSPPNLAMTVVRDQGNPWPSQGFNNMGFTINFRSLSGCSCAIAPDLLLTFYGDTDPSHSSPELDPYLGMTPIGLAGPGNALANFYWKLVSASSNNRIATGLFGIAPGYSVNKQVYVEVENAYVDQTITSAAVLSSASFGIALTVTVDTYVYATQPTPTPIPTQTVIPPTPTASPTPIASEGQVVAYPQPAMDTICFAYHSPSGGKVSIDIYNSAFQIVARMTDNAQGGKLEQSCGSVARLAPGPYFYRAKVGGFDFPLSQFGVAR